MEIRKLKRDELLYDRRVSAAAYFWKMTGEPSGDDYNEDSWAAFDGKKLCSRLVNDDYKINFDGNVVEMSGIGGVATLPEYRNKGLVRELFMAALPELRERGYICSFLYPFSYSFYRKFGYEICYSYNNVTIPSSFFKAYANDKSVTMHEKGGDISGFKKVYESFSRNKNLSVVRDEKMWRDMIDKDPYAANSFAFLVKDGGEAIAYLLFDVKKYSDDEGNALRIKEIAWARREGLYSALGFINAFGSQFEEVIWNAPVGLNALTMFPECYEIEIKCLPSGMNRIMDVEKALNLMKLPECGGKMIINVNDEFLPVNSGNYLIEFDDKNREVTRTDKTPDIITDVQTLTQLATGYVSFDQALMKRGFIVNGNRDLLHAAFPSKKLYIYEKF